MFKLESKERNSKLEIVVVDRGDGNCLIISWKNLVNGSLKSEAVTYKRLSEVRLYTHVVFIM
jgi:hypothetical protein